MWTAGVLGGLEGARDLKGPGQRVVERGQRSLTYEHRHQESAEPLLLDLLNLSNSTWSTGLAHDGEGIGVGDRTHRGGTEPGHPKEGGHSAHANDQEQVQVEAGALDHLTLGFADNQPRGVEDQG